LLGKSKALAPIIIIIIVIVAAFALVTVLVMSKRARAGPIVEEAFWQVDGQRLTDARFGEKVKAIVVVKPVEEYVGSIVVKVRKDIAWWPDSDYQVSTVPVSLRAGESKEIEVAFTPDERSGSRLRGYFIEITFQLTGTSWTMESSYPPRLRVLD
jgi:hypothetical protein